MSRWTLKYVRGINMLFGWLDYLLFGLEPNTQRRFERLCKEILEREAVKVQWLYSAVDLPDQTL